MALLSCFSQVSCWRPEQLHLLASDKIHLYLRDLCIYFWQVANKKPGDIIGEQALLSSTPR
jgi:hypothetical protein